MGESEKQINLSQQISSTSSTTEISISLKRNSQSLTSLISDLYSILTKMEEQNESQIVITEENIEEWLEILEQLQEENKTMIRKLKKQKN